MRVRAQGSKQLKLDPTIYDALQKERVAVGDVIYIEANSGAVKRVGRCDAYATEFDLEAEEYVPLPKALPSVALAAAGSAARLHFHSSVGPCIPGFSRLRPPHACRCTHG